MRYIVAQKESRSQNGQYRQPVRNEAEVWLLAIAEECIELREVKLPTKVKLATIWGPKEDLQRPKETHILREMYRNIERRMDKEVYLSLFCFSFSGNDAKLRASISSQMHLSTELKPDFSLAWTAIHILQPSVKC